MIERNDTRAARAKVAAFLARIMSASIPAETLHGIEAAMNEANEAQRKLHEAVSDAAMEAMKRAR
jgi:hypothetical protein